MKNTGVSIGISGPSGSGKTLIARSLLKLLPAGDVLILQEDSYYKDLSQLPFDERARYNFDHPDSFDHSLLVEHLRDLKAGRTINHPIYDYKTHTRRKETRKVNPHPVIILEGIMIFVIPELRDLLNFKIFVNTPLDICLIRRVTRDIQERGRNFESVIEQYLTSVRPMYFKYIEPTKNFVELLISNDGQEFDKIEKIAREIKSELIKTLII